MGISTSGATVISFLETLERMYLGQDRRKKFAEKPRSGVELSQRPGRFPGFARDDLVYFGAFPAFLGTILLILEPVVPFATGVRVTLWLAIGLPNLLTL